MSVSIHITLGCVNGIRQAAEARVLTVEDADRYIQVCERLAQNRADWAYDTLQEMRSKRPEIAQTLAYKACLADVLLDRHASAHVGFANHDDIVLARDLYISLTQETVDFGLRAWWYFRLGHTLYALNDVPQAHRAFIQAVSQSDVHPILRAYGYERLGYLAYYENRDGTQARIWLQTAIGMFDEQISVLWRAQVHLLQAQVLRSLGEMSDVKDLLRKTITLIDLNGVPQPSEKRAILFKIGQLFTEIDAGEDEAIACLRRVEQMSGDHASIDVTLSQVLELLGNIYFSRERYYEAHSAYTRSLEHNPDHPWYEQIHYRLALCEYLFGDYTHTVNRIRQMASNETLDYRWYDLLGNALFALERYNEAHSAYCLALENDQMGADERQKVVLYKGFSEQLAQNVS